MRIAETKYKAAGLIPTTNISRIVALSSQVLYIIALVAWAFKVFDGMTFMSSLPEEFFPYEFFTQFIDTYLIAILFSVLVLDLYLTRLSLWRLVFALLFGLIAWCMSLLYYDQALVYFFWFVMAYPSTLSLKHAARACWILLACFTVLTVLFHFLGYLPDRIQEQHGVVRHSYGFTWANCLSYSVTSMVLCWTYDFFDRWKPVFCVPGVILLVVAFIIGNGRMAFLLGLLMLCFATALSLLRSDSRFRESFERLVYLFAEYAFPLVFASCLLLTMACAVFPDLYSWMAGHFDRIHYMVKCFNESGIGLFGHEVNLVSYREAVETGKTWFNVDNATILYAAKYGLVFLVSLAVLLFCFARYCRSKGDIAMAFLLVLMALCSITENSLLTGLLSFPVFGIGRMLARPGYSARAPRFREPRCTKPCRSVQE